MSENCVKETMKEKSLIENSSNKNLLLLHRLHSDDVVQQKDVCASILPLPTPPVPPPPILPKSNESDIPTKKRKTRRGKSKRRHPYNRKNGSGSNNNSNHHNNNNNNGSRKLDKLINKPEAPYNSNQFLLEDHGDIENLDENLKYAEQISTTSGGGRTRDSSISIDTDGEFYSSPDDEEQFLIKDFVDQYESVQAERLQTMAKDQLIREYLALESKVEYLTKRLRKKEKSQQQQQQQQQQCDDNNATNNNSNCRLELEKEIDRLMNENDALKRELAVLHRDIDHNCNKSNNNNNNINNCTSSDSEDSETDSDDSCSSTTTTSSSSSSSSGGGSCCSKPPSPVIDYTQTNGHSVGVGPD